MFSFLRKPANPGLIWLDERSANKRIAGDRREGKISDEEESQLAKFARDGYFIIQLDLSADDASAIDRDVDRLWTERPANVAFAYDSPPKRFSSADPLHDRKPRYRIHELHSASEQAMRLYLHPQLHRYASLILGEPAVATQSLYFEYGSQQALHRDSTVVPTPHFGRLVAAWIALEDIAPESGPLAYVPASQHLPFFDFGTNEYTYDPSRHTPAEVDRAVTFYSQELQRSGLQQHEFLAKRGQALIWHSALMHGGAMPADENRTRKSFVVHYSTLRGQSSRECAVTEVVDRRLGESVFTTTEVMQRDNAFGFANPLNGTFLHRRGERPE
jgi:ectoine hydroxylase-related dioxygenase (phytanoyl-CoA dioxygenase family)